MKNELKNSEAFLAKKVGKSHSFSVPNNYFEDVESDIYASILKDNVGNNNNFIVPSSYFEEFEEKLFEKTNTKVIQLPLRKKVIKLIPAVAAACIVLFLAIQTNLFTGTDIFNKLDANDIEYWLDTESLSTIDIAEVLEKDLLNENDFSLTNINDENIEDYLIDYEDASFLNE